MDKKEIWLPVYGFEDYIVSNFGRVKSLKSCEEKILKPRINKGYLYIGLWKDGKRKNMKVHRLVATAFIPNPNNLPEVNHKDENTLNNFVGNLEWCNHKYNCNYGTRIDRVSAKKSKKVFQYTESGDLIGVFKSTHDVERKLGYDQTFISSCCIGKHEKAYGFVWKYK